MFQFSKIITSALWILFQIWRFIKKIYYIPKGNSRVSDSFISAQIPTPLGIQVAGHIKPTVGIEKVFLEATLIIQVNVIYNIKRLPS